MATKKKPAKGKKAKQLQRPSPRAAISRELDGPAAEWVALEDLEPFPLRDKAPEQVERQARRIMASIRRLGFNRPLVALRREGKPHLVLAGKTTLRAAELLKLPKVPVRLREGLTDEEARAVAVADNRLAQLAVYDLRSVSEAVGELSDELRGIAGFTEADLQKMQLQEDEEVGERPTRTHGRNAAPYTITLDAAQAADFERAFTAYREGFPESTAGDLVAFLAREHLRAQGGTVP